MPRRLQCILPSYFHVLNRAVRRHCLFEKRSDYEAFLRVLAETQRKLPTPMTAYCVMPNHFHLVIGPTITPALSTFMHRLTMTHSKRWHEYRGTRGTGPVYQGRFKAFRLKDDEHFLVVSRYVELNPVRAGLAARPELWPWSSAGRDGKNCDVVLNPSPILPEGHRVS